MNVLEDVSSDINFKDSLKNRTKDGIKNIKLAATKKLDGGGKKKKNNPKINQSIKRLQPEKKEKKKNKKKKEKNFDIFSLV